MEYFVDVDSLGETSSVVIILILCTCLQTVACSVASIQEHVYMWTHTLHVEHLSLQSHVFRMRQRRWHYLICLHGSADIRSFDERAVLYTYFFTKPFKTPTTQVKYDAVFATPAKNSFFFKVILASITYHFYMDCNFVNAAHDTLVKRC